jgi:hypothetical protein
MLTRFTLSAFQWNFLARDFKMLHERLSIFNLLYSGQISEKLNEAEFAKSNFTKLWIDPRSQLSKDLLITFEDNFLSMVKRISDPDAGNETKATSSKGLGLKRAMSKVDVSSTSMLLRTAFHLIFK